MDFDPQLILPPSPPASTERKRLTFKSVITYRGAVNRGDVFLCLPRQIRNRIFAYPLADFPELRYIEVPDMKDINYPPFANVSDRWYTEACEAIIQSATFSIATDCAIFNLMVFLNEFQENKEYGKVQSLEFTELSLFERGEFSANSTTLLQRCPNLKNVTLLVSFDDLIWTYERGGRELDVTRMTQKYDLHAITQLPSLETITLSLHPFMALGKRLAIMETERLACEQAGFTVQGLEDFWGLKGWLEMQALMGKRLIDVVCPRQDQFT